MSDSSKVAELPALRLKRNEDRRLHAGHLWIFSNEVDTQQTPLTKFEAGELVRVLAHNDRALGLAYVNPRVVLISARLLESWSLPDAAWLAMRMRAALRLRERLYTEPILSPGLRRVRWAARIGDRPLRFRLRRADRDCRDGTAQTANSAGPGAGPGMQSAALQERQRRPRNGGPAELCGGRHARVRRD